MTRAFLTLILLLQASLILADNTAVTVSGIIRDENEQVLPGVIITAARPGGDMLAYAVSADDGSFSLEIDSRPDSLTVEAGMLGYKTVRRTFRLPLKDLLIIDMKPDAVNLKEINVVAKPIRAQGDTLVYNVASFKSAADRNIEDVIRRMPGITVADNGAISYQGEPINRFYIEQVDMLHGSYALATRNLSADDIATVDIYENHQPVRVLENVEHSDKAALNLTLKKKSLLRPVGTVRAGGGYGDGRGLWLGEANVLLISPSVQSFVVGKASNTGMSYSEESAELTDRSVSVNTIAANAFSKSLGSAPRLDRRRYDFNRSALASANMTRRFDQDNTLTVNLTYNHDYSDIYSCRESHYFNRGDQSVDIIARTSSRPRTDSFRARLNFTRNAKGSYIDNRLTVNGAFASGKFAVRGTDNVNQSLDLDNFSVGNTLRLTARRGDRVWNVRSTLHYGNSPNGGIEASRLSDAEAYSEAIPGYISQKASGRIFYGTANTSMTWLFGSHVSIGGDLRLRFTHNTFRSHLLTDPPATSADRGLNDISGHRTVTELTPFFVWENDLLIWRTEVPLKIIDQHFRDAVTDRRYGYDRPVPEVNAGLRIGRQTDFSGSISGSYTQDVGDISNFITTPYYRSYRDLTAMGSGMLGRSSTANVTASVGYRNAGRGLFTSLIWSCDFRKSNLMSVSDISADQTVSSMTGRTSRSRNMDLRLNFSKRIRLLNSTVKAEGGWSRHSSSLIRSGEEMTSDVDNFSVSANARGNCLDDHLAIGLRAGYRYSRQHLDAGGAASSFDDLSTGLDISVFPVRAVEIFVRATYQRTQIADDRYLNPVFVDGGVRYRIRKWELELRLNNLTDRRNYAYQVFNGPDRFYYDFRLRPAEALLTARFTL